MKKAKAYYQSELGLLEIVGDDGGLKSVGFVEKTSPSNKELPSCVRECAKQLEEYFKGKRKEFSLPLQPEGTPFQKKVWQELMKIPYGKTVSYLEVAKAIGNRKSVRAVGKANGMNKMVIVVPCHRVIGHNGNLVGYGAGLWRKEWLLKHEGCLPRRM